MRALFGAATKKKAARPAACCSFEDGKKKYELCLPLWGPSAACGVAAALQAALPDTLLTPSDRDKLMESLKGAPPPPGALEVLQFSEPGSPKHTLLFHEAVTPQEVEQALRDVRAWLNIDVFELDEDASTPPHLTAVLGCEGDRSRRDRSKVGWAIARLCDRVVLTSNHPRAEPPMQVLEDVIAGCRAVLKTPGLGQLAPLREIHVVADRVDALKLGACMTTSGTVVVFGSPHRDLQEAADCEGESRLWLCNDRRILTDALLVVDKLAAENSGLDVSKVPWQITEHAGRKGDPQLIMKHWLPGQALHESYRQQSWSDGSITTPL